MTRPGFSLVLLSSLSQILCCQSFPTADQPFLSQLRRWDQRLGTTTTSLQSEEILLASRRNFFSHSIRIGLSTTVAWTFADGDASANNMSDSEEADKLKIAKGYERLTYLLENWVEETTQCGVSDNPYTSKGGCERTPIKVMEYLGYKNINDPLFKAEKTMRRLERLVPYDRQVEYLEAIEKWVEAADEGNGMAYISSWGEANPGGGKDRVALFIERAKKNVTDSRDSLSTIMDILNIAKLTTNP